MNLCLAKAPQWHNKYWDESSSTTKFTSYMKPIHACVYAGCCVRSALALAILIEINGLPPKQSEDTSAHSSVVCAPCEHNHLSSSWWPDQKTHSRLTQIPGLFLSGSEDTWLSLHKNTCALYHKSSCYEYNLEHIWCNIIISIDQSTLIAYESLCLSEIFRTSHIKNVFNLHPRSVYQVCIRGIR